MTKLKSNQDRDQNNRVESHPGQADGPASHPGQQSKQSEKKHGEVNTPLFNSPPNLPVTRKGRHMKEKLFV